jgi:hypothetical protein
LIPQHTAVTVAEAAAEAAPAAHQLKKRAMHRTDNPCISKYYVYCPRSRLAAVLQRAVTVGVVSAVVWAFIQLLQGTWREL